MGTQNAILTIYTLAVIIGSIFLWLQLKGLKRALRLTAFQGLFSENQKLNDLLFSHPDVELALYWPDHAQRIQHVDARAHRLAVSLLDLFDFILSVKDEGIIPKNVLRDWERSMIDRLRSSTVQSILLDRAGEYEATVYAFFLTHKAEISGHPMMNPWQPSATGQERDSRMEANQHS